MTMKCVSTIAVSDRIVIKEPSEAVKAFCRKELTLSNPEYIRKARLGYRTGSTPAEIGLVITGKKVSIR